MSGHYLAAGAPLLVLLGRAIVGAVVEVLRSRRRRLRLERARQGGE